MSANGTRSCRRRDFEVEAQRAEQAVFERRRTTYERPWNRWHHLRTIAGVGSFTLAAAAALVTADEG